MPGIKKPRVLLAGGGTGGHIFPLIAVIRSLKEKEVDIAFIGPEDFPLDNIREEEITVKVIAQAGKFRRYFSLKNFIEIFKIPPAFIQSLFFIRKWRPDIILGKGGYGTLAPIMATYFLKVPIILHESDTVPGLANKFLSRFADTVITSFKEAEDYFSNKNTVLLGNPVRLKYSHIEKGEARKELGLETKRKIILVTGGSQGAKFLNEIILKAAPQLLKRYALIVSSGENKDGLLDNIRGQKTVVVRPFFSEKELVAAYTLADVVISRGGAGSIFEIAAFGKPSIIIPLASSANDHQLKNAKAYEESGATVVLEEEGLDERILIYSIESILQNSDSRNYMATKAKEFSRPDAAEKIAEILLNKTKDRFWSKAIK